jgi:hypothetical protein
MTMGSCCCLDEESLEFDDFEFSNFKNTSEKSLSIRVLLLLRFEFDETLRVGMGMEAVVSKGLLFTDESILSLLSLTNIELLAKDSDGGGDAE